MLEQIAQPADMTLANADAGIASPFDNIADVHAMYEARIFRFLLFALRDRDAALSLTQDTFLQAWRTRASFRGDCSIATWLMRIAVNLLRNHTRTGAFRFWKKAAATTRAPGRFWGRRGTCLPSRRRGGSRTSVPQPTCTASP